MMPDECDARLTAAIDQWMLEVYALSIALNQGAVLKNNRRKVREYLNWSLSRRVYSADRAKELYAQWLDRLELVEEQPSV